MTNKVEIFTDVKEFNAELARLNELVSALNADTTKDAFALINDKIYAFNEKAYISLHSYLRKANELTDKSKYLESMINKLRNIKFAYFVYGTVFGVVLTTFGLR